jgi:hypothetical protein
MKWEYRTIMVEASGWVGGEIDAQKFTERLNQLGEEGWELVSVASSDMKGGGTREVIAVMKRQMK